MVNLLKCAEEIANTWYNFLRDKFDATEAENAHPDMQPIPSERMPSARLTRVEFNDAVGKMPNCHAVGPDGMPSEVFKYCSAARDALFELIERMLAK